ncbi:hypothetical protein KM043_018768 [Ampulex compressa]|nr:hypothetical protein KM043_018768 [Ampulex compressa]
MEFFRSLLRVVGWLEPDKVDFIGDLPLEVSQLILRHLDAESLLRVTVVSRKWLEVCRADSVLRRRARDFLRLSMIETEEEPAEIRSRIEVPCKERQRPIFREVRKHRAYRSMDVARAFGDALEISDVPKHRMSRLKDFQRGKGKSIRI